MKNPNNSLTESALGIFEEGFSCSQSVLAAFCETCDLDRNTALKLADGFGGGMGHMALTCGAVTGGIMVIGLKHGRRSTSDSSSKEKTVTLVREFMRGFNGRNGSTDCRDLLGCNISTDGGYAHAHEHNLFHTICPKYVRDAVEILEELL
ncbi:C-GCAxxG-C-C family protein [Candidatus Latescibacterota bacterium]